MSEIKPIKKSRFIKLSYQSEQELSQLLQSHKETQLTIKLNIKSINDLPKFKAIEVEFGKLIHVTELKVVVPDNTILTTKGYTLLSNAILKLTGLNKLIISIDEANFLEDEGLLVLRQMVNQLTQLVYLKFEIGINNYITSKAGKEFIDSLAVLTNLKTLNIHLEDIQKAILHNENDTLHFWNGVQYWNTLEKLVLSFNDHNYSEPDLNELFSHVVSLKSLRRLTLILFNRRMEARLLDRLFPYIGEMVELKSLKVNVSKIGLKLSDSQRKLIIKNLSNLKQLEKFRINAIDLQLFNNNFEEYMNLIGDLKQLKYLNVKSKADQILNYDQLSLLGQAILQLNQLTKFEFLMNSRKIRLSDDFCSDLSTAVRSMNDLIDLKLEFSMSVSENAFNSIGESFLHLPRLEKFQLYLKCIQKVKKTGLLENIRSLTNLKTLDFSSEDRDIEEELLLESITYLNQLETLNLKSNVGYESGFKNLEVLCKALMNLPKLKSLKFNIYISNLNSQEQLDLLEQTFGCLLDLEKLDIDFNIISRSQELQNVSLLKNLTKLKEIDINYTRHSLNVFQSSEKLEEGIQVKIQECSLTFLDPTPAEEFINILNSLAPRNVVKLDLTGKFSKYDHLQQQLGNICSKFKHIKRLSLRDSNKCLLHSYLAGIKEMKTLKTLIIDVSVLQFTEFDVIILNETIPSLKSLSTLKMHVSSNQNIEEAIETSVKDSFKQFKHFKQLNLLISNKTQNYDSQNLSKKEFYFAKALSLDFQNPPSTEISEPIEVDQKSIIITDKKNEQLIEENIPLINENVDLIQQTDVIVKQSEDVVQQDITIDQQNTLVVQNDENLANQSEGIQQIEDKAQLNEEVAQQNVDMNQQNVSNDQSKISMIQQEESLVNQYESVKNSAEIKQNEDIDQQNTPLIQTEENKIDDDEGKQNTDVIQMKEDLSQQNEGLNQKDISKLSGTEECLVKQEHITHVFKPIELELNLIQEKENEQDLYILKEFDLSEMQYLNRLHLQLKSSFETPQLLVMPKQLNDFRSLNKLNDLTINLKNIVLSEDQVNYISSNLKHLINLEFLYLEISSDDYYHILFEEFSNFTNLYELTVETNISDKVAQSLGNSLKQMKKLQFCDFIFTEKSTYGLEGMNSIINGLKSTTNIKQLLLNLKTSSTMGQECKMKIEECINNMKFLEQITVELRFTENIAEVGSKEFMSSIGSLKYLNTLDLKITQANPLNQEMLGELLLSMNKLEFLYNKKVSVHLQTDKQIIKLSQEFANVFNTKPKLRVTITTKENKVTIQQDLCHFSFTTNEMEQLQLEFLEHLTPSKEVLFDLAQSKLVKRINGCAAREILFKLNNCNNGEEDIDNLCEFISKIKTTFSFKLKVDLYGELDIDVQLVKLAQSLTKLKSIKELFVTILLNNGAVQINRLVLMLNILKDMQQLQDLYLNTKNYQHNKQMVPKIQRAIKRLVKFSLAKQRNYYSL